MIRFIDKAHGFQFEIDNERVENFNPGPDFGQDKVTFYFQRPLTRRIQTEFRIRKYFAAWLAKMDKRTIHLIVDETTEYVVENASPDHTLEYNTNSTGSHIDSFITSLSLFFPTCVVSRSLI